MAQTQGAYYVPHGSYWPIVGSIGLFSTVIGAANWFNGGSGLTASPLMYLGMAIIVIMMFGWFGTVIRESVAGMYNRQVDVSFRMGMMWFIFSE
ncbi:cytochrome c oxidase subunit 3, partial [Dokdonella sp.]|uniref:cytochrome c oxidase subunit 3 n=1 Tax=Dokdonella sp. TaxID=2291710 RepID=UPI003C605C10